MARLAKALAAISRGSAIAAEGRGASGTVSVAASVHSALREQRVQLCVFLEPLVLGYSFLRSVRPLGSLREKKAAGALHSSGLGFSLPWRLTDTVALS